MQQYFIEDELEVGKSFPLREDIFYHLVKVLRRTNDQFRVVDIEHKVYLCELNDKFGKVLNEIDEYNELGCKVTAIISLIKSDKFELILQKLTELGVSTIVPYNARRSVVKDSKADKKQERYQKIVTEAAEQSHRNIVPEVHTAINFKEVKNYLSDVNIIAYEKENTDSKQCLKAKSITFVIGPEGGFETAEIEAFTKLGFNSVSLGKRILRAETAAICLASQIVGENE